MNRDEVAQLIAMSAATFYRRGWYQRVPEQLAERCLYLNETGVLSTAALAAIFGVSTHKIEQVLKEARPKNRGTLNPRHLSILAYALSTGKLAPVTVKQLVREGTSVGMIEKLTGISRATLWRRLQ